MSKTLTGMTMGLGIVALAAQQVHAEGRNCGPREAMLQRLSRDFGETRQAIGLAGPGAMMEIFASGQSGSWTIAVTRADGTTCLIAAGQAFETLAEALPPNV